MTTTALPRLALALTAAGALAGGVWVTEHHSHPRAFALAGVPHPARLQPVDRTQVAVTPTSWVSAGGSSRTSSATPLV